MVIIKTVFITIVASKHARLKLVEASRNTARYVDKVEQEFAFELNRVKEGNQNYLSFSSVQVKECIENITGTSQGNSVLSLLGGLKAKNVQNSVGESRLVDIKEDR